MRKAAIVFQKYIRRWLAKQEAERRRKAVIIIRRYYESIFLIKYFLHVLDIYNKLK